MDLTPDGWYWYEAGGGDYIPPEKWGKDHWSTLGYLETRVVDHRGVIDNRNMRCAARLHRSLAHEMSSGTCYPTRLRGGEVAENHDDWSCLEDMVAAGFLEAEFRTFKHGAVFGGDKARVRFTRAGLHVAAALRTHKASGGNFADFAYGPTALAAAGGEEVQP